MDVKGKVALVTGAGRGIGFEIARELGRLGFHVVMTGRDPQRLGDAAAKLTGEQLHVTAHPGDVTSEPDVDRLIASLDGKLHVLVNNAGLIDEPDPTWEAAVSEWDDVIATNLRGPFLLCRAAVPLMKAGHWGRIVNVSSGMGTFSEGLSGGHAAYRVSKAALNGLTHNLAAELTRDPILVNAMCPGWVRTDMGGDSAPRSVEQGADTAIFLATLPDGGPSGKIWRDRAEIAW